MSNANPVDPFIRSVLVPQQQEAFGQHFTFDRIGTVKKGECFLGGLGTIERWEHDDVPPVVSMIILKRKPLCPTCNISTAAEPHICPYAGEIGKDSETMCACCDDCVKACVREI